MDTGNCRTSLDSHVVDHLEGRSRVGRHSEPVAQETRTTIVGTDLALRRSNLGRITTIGPVVAAPIARRGGAGRTGVAATAIGRLGGNNNNGGRSRREPNDYRRQWHTGRNDVLPKSARQEGQTTLDPGRQDWSRRHGRGRIALCHGRFGRSGLGGGSVHLGIGQRGDAGHDHDRGHAAGGGRGRFGGLQNDATNGRAAAV
mmetsp:Transcript_5609/g.15843  ORF Transcript_5609/g.15843 Transcript_5609/m.15843 type:complete len:201 (+) Transcript_5609:323-925(+)